jgi:hypothetical protein
MPCRRSPCVAIRLLKYEWNQRNTHNQHGLQAGLGASEPGGFPRQFWHHDAANRYA